jgi:hypothetical protein
MPNTDSLQGIGRETRQGTSGPKKKPQRGRLGLRAWEKTPMRGHRRSFVIRRGAATSAVKDVAELGQDNRETDGNEIDTNVLVALVECASVCLRKFDGAGLSTFRAF